MKNTILIIIALLAGVAGALWYTSSQKAGQVPQNQNTNTQTEQTDTNPNTNTGNQTNGNTANTNVSNNPAPAQNSGNDGDSAPQWQQAASWTPCDGLFPYTGNQGNSTFIDTTAGANFYNTGIKDKISNGYEIRGCVRQIAGSYGNWAPFEGQLGSYQIKDAQGNVIVSGILPALPTGGQADWMSAASAGADLAFRTTINHDFSSYSGQDGTLLLKNENPSGEVANMATKSFDIRF